MEGIRKYRWVVLIVLVTVVLTLVAVFRVPEESDPYVGLPTWAIPLICLGVLFIISFMSRGPAEFNRPAFGWGSLAVVILGVVLLFAPDPAAGYWYHPYFGGSVIALIANL